MEHAGDIGEFPHDGEGVGVSLPIVDDHRQLKLPRQRKLAAWKGLAPEELARITTENGKRLFRIP